MLPHEIDIREHIRHGLSGSHEVVVCCCRLPSIVAEDQEGWLRSLRPHNCFEMLKTVVVLGESVTNIHPSSHLEIATVGLRYKFFAQTVQEAHLGRNKCVFRPTSSSLSSSVSL